MVRGSHKDHVYIIPVDEEFGRTGTLRLTGNGGYGSGSFVMRIGIGNQLECLYFGRGSRQPLALITAANQANLKLICTAHNFLLYARPNCCIRLTWSATI